MRQNNTNIDIGVDYIDMGLAGMREVYCPYCDREHSCSVVDWEEGGGYIIVTYWCNRVEMEFKRKEKG